MMELGKLASSDGGGVMSEKEDIYQRAERLKAEEEAKEHEYQRERLAAVDALDKLRADLTRIKGSVSEASLLPDIMLYCGRKPDPWDGEYGLITGPHLILDEYSKIGYNPRLQTFHFIKHFWSHDSGDPEYSYSEFLDVYREKLAKWLLNEYPKVLKERTWQEFRKRVSSEVREEQLAKAKEQEQRRARESLLLGAIFLFLVIMAVIEF
jgi:hypothetical protein